MRDSPQQHPGGLRRIDDTFDDTRDDNWLRNYVAYAAKPPDHGHCPLLAVWGSGSRGGGIFVEW
jgi:hypothetical protein